MSIEKQGGPEIPSQPENPEKQRKMEIKILPPSGRISNLSVAGVELTTGDGLVISRVDVIRVFDDKGERGPAKVVFPEYMQASGEVIDAILEAYKASAK